MGDWVTGGNFTAVGNAVKLPWFANESASEADSHDDEDFDEDEKERQEPLTDGLSDTKPIDSENKDLEKSEPKDLKTVTGPSSDNAQTVM
jgi:hypothetical protein